MVLVNNGGGIDTFPRLTRYIKFSLCMFIVITFLFAFLLSGESAVLSMLGRNEPHHGFMFYIEET